MRKVVWPLAALALIAAIGFKVSTDLFKPAPTYSTLAATASPIPTVAPTPTPDPVRTDGAPTYVAEFIAHLCDADIQYLAAHSVSPQPTTKYDWAERIGRQGSDCSGYEYAGPTSEGYAYLLKFVDGQQVMYLFKFTGEKFSAIY